MDSNYFVSGYLGTWCVDGSGERLETKSYRENERVNFDIKSHETRRKRHECRAQLTQLKIETYTYKMLKQYSTEKKAVGENTHSISSTTTAQWNRIFNKASNTKTLHLKHNRIKWVRKTNLPESTHNFHCDTVHNYPNNFENKRDKRSWWKPHKTTWKRQKYLWKQTRLHQHVFFITSTNTCEFLYALIRGNVYSSFPSTSSRQLL